MKTTIGRCAAWIGLTFSTLMLPGCDDAGIYVYKDSLTNTRLLIDDRKGEVTDGHLTWKLRNCDQQFHCISSSVLDFGVPKKIGSTSTWTVGTLTYKLVGKRNVDVFGSSIDAFMIEQSGPQRNWFLYSEDKGLVGMGSLSGDRPSFYWLTTKCGFGGAC